MKNTQKPPDAAHLLHDLQHNEELRHQPVVEAGLAPYLAKLRKWQSARMTETYADFLAHPRYRPACLFFLSDIYAPRNFSQRDYDIERIHTFLSQIMPPPMIRLLTEVVELNHQTNQLDQQLAQVLVQRLGVTDTITTSLYAEAYRLCDNYATRVDQIDLTAQVIAEIGKGAHRAVIGVALKVARGPAQRAGWVELYSFLERGYQAFKPMRDVKTFADAIQHREQRILDRIYSCHPDPFVISQK